MPVVYRPGCGLVGCGRAHMKQPADVKTQLLSGNLGSAQVEECRMLTVATWHMWVSVTYSSSNLRQTTMALHQIAPQNL